VLWIKGNPGTGKSTLVKHTLRHCGQNFKDHIVAAYFFNARGDRLEKTPLGMLRSLSYQLLRQESSLYGRFVPKFRDKLQKHRTGEWEWRQSELKDFLLSEIQWCQSKPLLLLIDALDECNKSDVEIVVEFLEKLSIKANGTKVAINICLSSRHYPSIRMENSLELVVERREEHGIDISRYVRDKLIIRDEEIEKGVLQKASSIFLWVVLVVAMLNKAYQEGKVEGMRQKLSDVPEGLEEMFETLLSNDNPDKHETILMLQCVLFTRRPLTPEELYFAMIAGTNPENLKAWNQSKITADIIRRRIITSSRGLIETRKVHREIVQFIHESVNDFLLRNRRLETLDPTIKLDAIGASHDCLSTCCMSYLMMSELSLAKEKSQVNKLSIDYPFLKYASTYILDHAEIAQGRSIKPNNFLHCVQQQHENFERFRHFHNAFERIPGLGCDKGATPLYILSFHGCHELAKVIICEEQADVNAQGGPYGNALQAASANGKEEVVRLLLEKGANVNAQGGLCGNALQAASANGKEGDVRLLLEKGANVNAQGGLFGNALQAASADGKEEVVRLLLENGADVNAQGGPFSSALQAASANGKEEAVQLLLENGANVNAQGGLYGNALQAASANGKEEIVRLLLEKGANINAQGGFSGNALCAALIHGKEEVMDLLLEKGADISAQGGVYSSVLQVAESTTESDRKRNSAVYHPTSTVIVITTFTIFFILMIMRVWKGIKHVSG
jgi:ankyrin repeat protein